MDLTLVRKRVVRLCALSLLAVIVMEMYFRPPVDTEWAMEELGLPRFLGSVWMNLMAVPLVAFATYLASKYENRTGFPALATALAVSSAILAIPFGFIIGPAFVIGSCLIVVLAVLILIGIEWVVIRPKTKTIWSAVSKFFWPT